MPMLGAQKISLRKSRRLIKGGPLFSITAFQSNLNCAQSLVKVGD
jgi:hypothetical protein